MRTESFAISAFDRAFLTDGVIVYTSGKQNRQLDASIYNFRNAYILIFDKNGKLCEGGHCLDGHDGCIQKYVEVPAGGFAAAFNNTHPLFDYYMTVTEDAFISGSTVSLTYPLTATVDFKNAMLDVVLEDAVTDENAVKYLFVGNSCTYVHGVPLKFKALCAAAGEAVEVDYCTYGNAYFYEYADENHPRGGALRKILQSKKYDYIILQDGCDGDMESRIKDTEAMLSLVEQNGALPLFYIRYGVGDTLEQKLIHGADMYSTFTTFSQVYGIPCADTTRAFNEYNIGKSKINLYADDFSHHNKEGSYLIACCLMKGFLGISPVGNEYTAGLCPETAAQLQSLAEKYALECQEQEQEPMPVIKKAKREVRPEFKWALIGAAAGAAVALGVTFALNAKRKRNRKNKKRK